MSKFELPTLLDEWKNSRREALLNKASIKEHLFLYFSPFSSFLLIYFFIVTEKDVKMLTNKGYKKHPFAGRNTQQLYNQSFRNI